VNAFPERDSPSPWPAPWPSADASSFPPPPPPPPPPVDTGPQPRWGLGDVAIGAALFFLGGGVLFGILVVVLGYVDVRTGEVETLPTGLIAVGVASGWLGLAGWPVVASHLRGRKSLRQDFGFAMSGGDIGWGLLGGIAALALGIVANIFWALVQGSDPPSNAGFLPESPGVVGGAVLFLAVAVGTPIAEELFFRGLFLRAAAKRWNMTVAVIVSSVVFGFFHVAGLGWASLFIVVVTMAYGFVFALLAIWRGRLGPAIVAHMTVNGTALLFAFLAPTTT
jgi:uncharacterized protein